MKGLKRLFLLTAVVMGLVLSVAPAAYSAKEKDPKIGFINIKKAVADTNEFKRIKGDFDRRFQKEQKTIAVREEEVKKLFEELNKQGFVLSPELKKQKEANFIEKKKALERYVQDKNEEFSQMEKEITAKITKRMLDVLKNLGKKRKFTLIIEKAATFYFDNAQDVTKTAVSAYNKSYK